MKRDMDLIRRICIELEEKDPHNPMTSMNAVQDEVFREHALLLMEARLAEGMRQENMSGQPYAALYRLTWTGHDFLDAARSDTVWKKARESVLKPGMSFTFDLLKEWLKAEITQGLPTLRA